MSFYNFHVEFREALAALDGELGVREGAFEALGFAFQDALQQERAKAQKLLSRARLRHKYLLWRGTLDPASRALAILHMASSEERRPLASEWLTTAPFNDRTTLPDAIYRTAIRKRLDIPVSDHGEGCRVLVPTHLAYPTHRACGKPLKPHADHAQRCARSEIQERHNGVADVCAAFNREARHVVHTAAEVPGILSSTKKRDRPGLTFWCELRLRGPGRGRK